MTTSLSMIPLAKIRPSDGNPRTVFDDERMAELIESVKRHGIITPLTLSHDGDGRYAIIAGERRYRAAKAAKLREVPAQIREADGATLTLAVAENVIRADLSPMEEARAYRRLADEHGDAAKVAKLVGKSERLICGPARPAPPPRRDGAADRGPRVPLACAPVLVRIAEREPLLADLAALWLERASARCRSLPHGPRRGTRRRAARRVGRRWPAGAPGRLQRRRLPRPAHPRPQTTGSRPCSRSSATTRRRSRTPTEHCPRSRTTSEHDWQARQTEERRERDCFALGEDDADAARAFGCLLELPGRQRTRAPLRHRSRLARGSARAEDRRPRRSGGRAQGAARRPQPLGIAGRRRKEERRRERERQHEARVSARSRNLDLGAALARWQPKLDTDAIKLLGQIVLEQHGRAAAWAHRLCVDQPATTNKQGRETVRYPRGADAERAAPRRGARRPPAHPRRPRTRSRSCCASSSRSGSPTRTGCRTPTGKASTSPSCSQPPSSSASSPAASHPPASADTSPSSRPATPAKTTRRHSTRQPEQQPSAPPTTLDRK